MMRRPILWIAAVAGFALGAWAFPLFHVVPLHRAREQREQARFNAAEFAGKFWDESLMRSLSQAHDARAVLDAIDADFRAAGEKYGRTLGISNSYYVFIRGRGRVVDVGRKGVGLAVRDGPAADVVLPVGMVFGNTVRDGTSLLVMDEFPNSQDFNDVATELNRIVETRVLPRLRDRAAVGREVRFVGCAEVPVDATRRKPLKVVPVSVEVSEPGQPESTPP